MPWLQTGEHFLQLWMPTLQLVVSFTDYINLYWSFIQIPIDSVNFWSFMLQTLPHYMKLTHSLSPSHIKIKTYWSNLLGGWSTGKLISWKFEVDVMGSDFVEVNLMGIDSVEIDLMGIGSWFHGNWKLVSWNWFRGSWSHGNWFCGSWSHGNWFRGSCSHGNLKLTS